MFKLVQLINQDGRITKAAHVTREIAVIFKGRLFVVRDRFFGQCRHNSNFKMTCSLVIVDNIAVTTLKSVNNVGANI